MTNQIPTNLGKNLKVFGVRGSRIGDTLMSVPVYAWVRKKFPDCFTYWQIARRHEAAIPLWLNHPLINELVVSDCEEGWGPRDVAIANTCRLVFDVMPKHPDGDRNWSHKYNIFEETWRMAGLPIEEYHALDDYSKRPHLTQWFETNKQPKKTVSIWPASNYGTKQDWHSRYPSRAWMISLVKRLVSEGYKVFQCGHPNDYANEGGSLSTDDTAVFDVRHLSFFDQIKLSLGCSAIIGTDSGSTLVLASYESVPTIQLLTDHMQGEKQLDLAFASNSPTNVPMFARGSADNINIDEVIATVKVVAN